MQDIILIAPFSHEAAQLLEDQGLTLEDLAYDPLLERSRSLARERLIDAIEGRRRLILDRVNPMNEVYSYLAARLIAARVGRSMLSRLATYESKRFGELSKRLSLDQIREIASNTFKFTIREDNGMWLDLISYLRGCVNIGGSKWRLVNRVLINGYILVTEHELRRLLEDHVKRKIIETPRVDLPEPLENIAKEISNLFSKRMRIRMKFKKPKEGRIDLPPCIKDLIAKLRKGENLTHQARFALTSFLLNIGWSKEQILDLFRSSPDFNEKIALYQISHIERRGYKVPSCETMKSWGLCPGDCGRKYPLEGNE